MNPLNYASLEASKKLVEARIVLKTDIQWANVIGFDGSEDWELNASWGEYPAPTMADVWRALPDQVSRTGVISEAKALIGHKDNQEAMYWPHAVYINTNPTDALIDLLIYIKGVDAPK